MAIQAFAVKLFYIINTPYTALFIREKGATKRVQELESKLKRRKWRQNQRTSKKCFPGVKKEKLNPFKQNTGDVGPEIPALWSNCQNSFSCLVHWH